MYPKTSLYSSSKLLDNLYCYLWEGMGNNCNTYLFTDTLKGNRPHILIDPGHTTNEFKEPCFEKLLESMKKDGIEARDIGLIINTHAHPDHCEANQALVEKSRKGNEVEEINHAIIALSKEDDEYRKTVGEKLYTMLGITAPEFEPFFYLSEGKLNLGNKKLQILHTPGHSPGSLCIYWPEEKILITGDVIFYGSVGRTDFPGGSINILEQSIRKLSHLEVEYLLPGHATEYGHIIEGKEKVKRNFEAIIRYLF